MRVAVAFILSFFSVLLYAQHGTDAWMEEQLDEIVWEKRYSGVLADYHPVDIILASDKKEVAGYLFQKDKNRRFRLIGEWRDNGLFQLQELDTLGRLTGYLTGQITSDQLALKWLSVDQSRVFDIRATTDQLIKISANTPSTEWIEINTKPSFAISLQKTGDGLVAGFVIDHGEYIRFDGQCLDGSCSIWKATCRKINGEKISLQLRQKTAETSKAVIGTETFTADMLYVYPLQIQHEMQDNGFIDLVYPLLQSDSYKAWIRKFWDAEQEALSFVPAEGAASRLSFRSSAWVEIIGETASVICGWITLMNANGGKREAFLLNKKDDELLMIEDVINSPDDLARGTELALATGDVAESLANDTWMTELDYDVLLPTPGGVVMATSFNAVYGDVQKLLSMDESRSLIKRKYWKLLGW